MQETEDQDFTEEPQDQPSLTPTGKLRKEDRLVTHKQIIKLVASTSGYNEYEVEDVLKHLGYHVAMAIKNDDRPVELKYIGQFRKSIWSARTRYSQLVKRYVTIPEKISVTYVPSNQLKYELNRELNRKDEGDE